MVKAILAKFEVSFFLTFFNKISSDMRKGEQLVVAPLIFAA